MMNQYKIEADFEVTYSVTEEKNEGGVRLVRFAFDYAKEMSEKDRVIEISFSFPITDITGFWYPGSGVRRALVADWVMPKNSMTAQYAPVMGFYNGNGLNRRLIGWSEINKKVDLQYGVHEENGEMICVTRFYLSRQVAPKHYEVVLRDVETVKPYWEVLRDMMNWWEEEKQLTYFKAPSVAKEPLYSFWYSYHQEVNEANVEAESRRAADMGFAAIIVDDGWQTADNNRGYAYCGDWEMEPSKFPDFPAHVKRVQAMGLKYMLWFSVPFVGIYTKAWEKYKEKMLYMFDEKWGVLDIRYPECREYLIGIYERAVFEWGLDGLKLDFIDCFQLRPESPGWNEQMDYTDVQDALVSLLTEVNERLRAKKPDILLEYRQAYVGPQIQTFGNMLRVGDCPYSGVINRNGIADLRLLSKDVAVHSDMLMWHKDEKAEDAALQILNCLFGTLQFSVKLDTLTEETKKMTAFWMQFMREHRDLLQTSTIRPLEPENSYPEISVWDGKDTVLAHYSKGRVVNLTEEHETLYYVHAVKEEPVVIRNCDGRAYHYQILNCMGEEVEYGEIAAATLAEAQSGGKITAGALTQLHVPCAGMVIFKSAC